MKTRYLLWLWEHGENNCRDFSFSNSAWFMISAKEIKMKHTVSAEGQNLFEILQEHQIFQTIFKISYWLLDITSRIY